jgi:DNA-directed RNA polymerase subunit M/transcription elongation factor TFIIS
MAIETRCNQCGTILTIAGEHAGKIARCPSCRTQYTVPAQSDEAALDAVCHYCGAALKRGEQANEKFKTCDECRASIVENELEIEAELQTAEQSRKMLLCSAVLVAGLVLLAWLAQVIRDYMTL